MNALDAVLLAVLVAAGALVAYVYLGYPALLWLLARLRPRPVAFGRIRPPVTFVVPAHDEEAVIGGKVDDCLAQQYPADRLEVVVVSDGSTDRTEEIVRERAARDPRVRLLPVPRGGKAAALNAGVRAAAGEVLVFTDANALLAPESLVRLVEPFADPEVGGVCGRKRHRAAGDADATARGEGLYWRWEQWQKSLESRIGSVYAADGTLYAVRRSLYVPVADPAQADDIAVSARVPLAGRRLLFEPAAVAWEEPPAEGRAELRRKVRVTNHSLRALWNLGPRLWRSGFYSVELLSHKLLRHLLPFPLLALLAANVLLVVRLGPGAPGRRPAPPPGSPGPRRAASGSPSPSSSWPRERSTPWASPGSSSGGPGPGGCLSYRFLTIFLWSTPQPSWGRCPFCAGCARRSGPPGRDSEPAVARTGGPMKRTRPPVSAAVRPTAAALFAAFLVASGGAAPAQPPPWEDPVFGSELRVNAFRFDNFFQAPEGVPEEEVDLTRVEGRLSVKPAEGSPFDLYTRARFDSYSEDLDEAWAVGVGTRYETRRREADVFLEYEQDRPVFDVGDEFERANVLRLSGEHAWHLTEDWQVTALGEFRQEEFEQTATKDNDFLEGGAALRYRGWGYDLSPEIGAQWGSRDADDPNEDHDQRDLWIKLRSVPVEGLYVSLRYRYRFREYDAADPAASNFEREDDRRSWTLAADYALTGWLGLNAYVDYQDADSTKESRVFETTLAGVGVTFGF